MTAEVGEPEPPGLPSPSPDVPLGRTAAGISALTTLSRATGFVRVLVVTAVLGRGALGDVYQTTNTVPNVLFELFAAGALQAALVPSLVQVLDRDGRAAAERFAGAVLGSLSVLLAGVTAVGILAAPWVVRALFAAEPSAVVRAAKVELGTVFLWFFLPQLVLYGIGLVATGALNAQRRFLAPVLAPAVNNAVVIVVYLLFARSRDGAVPTLELTGAQKVLLAGGTTLGVLALTAVPVVALRRSGFRLRPRVAFGDTAVRHVGRAGGWAALFVAGTQALLVGVLVFGNGVPGGVVTFTFALTFFLLPFALFATPVATALYPGLARSLQAGDRPGYAEALGRGLRVTSAIVVPCAAALGALAWPIVRVATFGEAAEGDLSPFAHAVAAMAPGVVGYSLLALLVRGCYAEGDARTPAVVQGLIVVVGVVGMAVASVLVADADRAAALGAAYALAYTVGAVGLAVLVTVRNDRLDAWPFVAATLAAGVVATVVMAVVGAALDGQSRVGALATLVVAGAVGVAAYAGALRLVVRRPLRPLVTAHG